MQYAVVFAISAVAGKFVYVKMLWIGLYISIARSHLWSDELIQSLVSVLSAHPHSHIGLHEVPLEILSDSFIFTQLYAVRQVTG